MEIEVVAVCSREPGCPALRDVDEDNVERVAASLQRSDRAKQAVRQHDMGVTESLHFAIEPVVQLYMAILDRAPHVEIERFAETGPGRQVVLALRRLVLERQFLHEAVESVSLPCRCDRRDPDGIRNKTG